MKFFPTDITDEEIRKEKAKARAIRKTHWWKRKCSQGTCYYCGRSVQPGALTMDHLVPLIRGGTSSKGNVVPACKSCNNKKKHLLPIEWEEYLEHLKRSNE
jgi:5-methylcytosine-specific restriction endonuclease McrA